MAKTINVLALSLGQIPSAIVGVIEPLSELCKEGLIRFQFSLSINVTKQMIASSDVIICVRSCDKFELNVIEECKRLGRYIIYYMDDDLLNIPSSANSHNHFENDLVKNTILSIMSLSNCLWTNNSNIANLYGKRFEKTVITHAPAVLMSHIPLGEPQQQKYITIGFAGGIDHKAYLEEMLEVPISQIISLYGRKVKFEFFGAKPNFIEKFGLEHIPYQTSYSDYINIMKTRNWEIGLAPLQESEFHACKYFNKFLEYGSIGAAGVYSNVQPFTQVVVERVNGLLVNNDSSSWFNAMKQRIEESTLRNEIIENSKNKLNEEFTVKAIANSILTQIPELQTFLSPSIRINDVNLQLGPTSYAFSKLLNIFKVMGFKAPIFIVRKIGTKLIKKIKGMT